VYLSSDWNKNFASSKIFLFTARMHSNSMLIVAV